MSTNEEITQNDVSELEPQEAAEGASELELPPPVVTRTRSGRRVRTPAALLDSQVASLTPSRRTRKSVSQEEPAPQSPAEPEEEPSLESQSTTTVTCSATDKSDELMSDACNEKENEGNAGVTLLEPVPEPPNKTAKKRTHSQSSEKQSIPLGKPKSGRVWKDRNKQRFSALLRDKPLCTTWEKKMVAKREKEMVKQYFLQLKGEKNRKKEEKRMRREENLKRRAENERKAEVVQVIRNTTKIKRMKKKQLRKIEKRDTLALLQKSQPKTGAKSQKSQPRTPKETKGGGSKV